MHEAARIAQRRVFVELRAGRLHRKPCQVCGQRKRLHAHHPDYAFPLDVIWLCPPHHGMATIIDRDVESLFKTLNEYTLEAYAEIFEQRVHINQHRFSTMQRLVEKGLRGDLHNDARALLLLNFSYLRARRQRLAHFHMEPLTERSA